MNINALDVTSIFDLANKFIIVSGRSDRHVQGITNRITEDLKNSHFKPTDIEGYDKAHWVLIDCDDIIIHVFYEPTRELYDLDSLWSQGKQINVDSIISSKEAA